LIPVPGFYILDENYSVKRSLDNTFSLLDEQFFQFMFRGFFLGQGISLQPSAYSLINKWVKYSYISPYYNRLTQVGKLSFYLSG